MLEDHFSLQPIDLTNPWHILTWDVSQMEVIASLTQSHSLDSAV
jgi:hypothetical protein